MNLDHTFKAIVKASRKLALADEEKVNQLLLDLDYKEDSVAEVDMNVVITGRKKLVEVQATAEGSPFSVARLNSLIQLARAGIETVNQIQIQALNSR